MFFGPGRKMKNKLPKICLRADRNLAYVTLNGRKIYLGRYGSPESFDEYQRVIAEYLTRPKIELDGACRVAELTAAFLERSKTYYVKNGKSTGQHERYCAALAPLCVPSVARLRVRDFGVAQLRTVQRDWEASGRYCRTYINTLINCIRTVFKWGVSEGFVESTTLTALQSLPPLKIKRSTAREAPPVLPVAPEVVAATIPFLTSPVAAMVRVQSLIGCRPGEICEMRACDLDASGEIWIYTPPSHKTEHLARAAKKIPIGPKAQSILAPYLLANENAPTAALFSPRDAWLEFAREKRAKRKTPLTPSQRKRGLESNKRLNEFYSSDAYNKAVQKGAARAGVPAWSPNQLRHLVASRVRALYGLEAAQCMLGHASADTTQIYAERDFARAVQIAAEIG